MPFLAPLIPAIVGGAAAAGTTAIAGAISGAGRQPAGTPGGAAQQQAQQNTQGGLQQQQNFLNAIQGLTGQGINAQGQALGQLEQGARGQGPNPALAQLQQATGQNVAQQAALMGSQRGVSVNPGMLARQAAQQGSAIQQNAVGQEAILQAQQQMAYQQMLANQANNVVGQGQNALNSYQTAAQGQQNALLGTLGAQQQGQNYINAGQQGFSQDVLGGVAGALGQGVAGMLSPSAPAPAPAAAPVNLTPPPSGPNLSSSSTLPAMPIVWSGGKGAHGGLVQSQSGPSSFLGQTLNMSRGGHVPGKPKVMGDDEKNDTVPAMLSPGEIVVPRTKAKDPKKAAAFAHAVAMRGKRK